MGRDALIGAVVAGHRIESLLGEGGMSVVYRARHERLGKVRALKLLPPQLARDKAFRKRFEREWRLAASIEHPNIVEVLDAGEANKHLYIVMRLIDGPDLGTLVRDQGPLPVQRLLSLLEQVAGALDAAHDQGLVHRDVTPRTILVGPGDWAYLADFGVAPTSSSRGLTQSGSFVGNLEYAAPEQIEGKAVDARVDIYALGGVLYTGLTGRPPYERESDAQLIHAHLNESPEPPSRIRHDLPAALDTVVQKALARDPNARFETCTALVDAARAALRRSGHETVGVPVPTILEDVDDPTALDASVEEPAGAGPVSSESPGGEKVPLRIFINYRRGDSSGYAGRLYDALAGRSENWQVFMDIDAIEPGTDFVEVIDKALGRCDVVIAVIGRQWITATDARGQRRLDDPNDFVRMELAAALERKIRVIPALVQGTEMPSSDEFPDVLEPLARRQGLELSDGRWRYDVDRLVQVLQRIEQEFAEEQAAEAAELERLEQERKGRAARRAAAALAAREAAEQEALEADARQAADREAAEREMREAAEREARQAAAEQEARPAAEREAAEQEAREAAEREAAEREAAEREAASEATEPTLATLGAEASSVLDVEGPQQVTVEDAPREVAATVPAEVDASGARERAHRRRRVIVLASAAAVLAAGGGIAAAVVSLGSSSPTAARENTTPTEQALRLGAVRTNRSVAVPGEPYDVKVTASGVNAGKAARDPAVSCHARAGRGALRGTSRLQGDEVHCRWNVPFSAAGATLAGSITVTQSGTSRSRAFRARVGPVPETLVVSRAAPPAATEGGEAEATFPLRWLRKDGKRRSVAPGSVQASCRSTIPGYPVAPRTAVTPSGVVCRVRVPNGAGGRKITIGVTVRSKGQSARSTISAAIASRPQPQQPPPPPPPQPPPPDPCDPLSPSYDPLNPNCP